MNRPERTPGLRARLHILGIAALGCSALACGATGAGMAQVTGKVTYQGKPVPKGVVSFVPVGPGGRNATGQLDEGGNYRLQTENPNDGAPLGDHVVTISAREEEVVLDYIPKKPIPPKRLVPAKYENPASSGLKATVKAGSNAINFDLTD